jgi:hypothetical protein
LSIAGSWPGVRGWRRRRPRARRSPCDPPAKPPESRRAPRNPGGHSKKTKRLEVVGIDAPEPGAVLVRHGSLRRLLGARALIPEPLEAPEVAGEEHEGVARQVAGDEMASTPATRVQAGPRLASSPNGSSRRRRECGLSVLRRIPGRRRAPGRRRERPAVRAGARVRRKQRRSERRRRGTPTRPKIAAVTPRFCSRVRTCRPGSRQGIRALGNLGQGVIERPPRRVIDRRRCLFRTQMPASQQTPGI